MKKVTMSDIPRTQADMAPLGSGGLMTGTQVWRQAILNPDDSSNFNFAIVAFDAGSRNKFHIHSGDQILVITDGEPTAHLEGDRSYFSYPPSYRTEMETLREVRRCTQEDILINTFMLENNYQLVNFVDRMTRINRGRAFYSSAANLSEFVLVDYLNNRRKHVAA